MSSREIYLIHKNIFDEVVEKIGLTKERLDTYIEIIADDEGLNDRHYDSLRRYFLKRYYELSSC